MIIKLTADNVPSYVQLVEIGPGTMGYIINFPDGSSDHIAIGDYIIEDSPTNIRVIRIAEYNASQTLRDDIAEDIGRATSRTLTKAIRGLSTNGSERITLAEYLCTVFVFLGDGQILDARDMASGKPLTSAYTASRKTFVVTEIEKALALI
jgi:hypothetical protein